jgi:hypothetical protein
MNLESASSLAKIKEGSISAIRAYFFDAPWAGWLLTSRAGQRFIIGNGMTTDDGIKLLPVLATTLGAFQQDSFMDKYRRGKEQTMKFLGTQVDKGKEKLNDAFK